MLLMICPCLEVRMIVLNTAAILVDKAAVKFGDKTAFRCSQETLSFFDLQRKAKAVGSFLIGATSKGAAPIAVYLPKSCSCIVSFFGALYAGKSYVPLNHKSPIARIKSTVETLCPQAIITNAEGKALLESFYDADKLYVFDEIIQAELNSEAIDEVLDAVIDTDPIYILFTSGSTGTPKGVTVSHKSVIDYAQWVVETFAYDSSTILANQAPFHFDNSVYDIYSALLSGAEVIIAPESLFAVPLKIPKWLDDNRVTAIFWVPTIMIAVANSGALRTSTPSSLKVVTFAGEAMPNQQLNIWRQELPNCLYANLYGPTEITVDCTYYIVDRDFLDVDPLPIGKARKNMRTYILDEHGKQSRVGDKGELHVSGTGLALGYWRNVHLTSEVFIENPIDGMQFERVYATGDICWQDEEGLIYWTGRKDDQIKRQGNRIELGDIECAAAGLEYVDRTCVLFDSETDDIYIFVESSQRISLLSINKDLSTSLPSYMLPTKVIELKSFPMTSNGKIDRVRLREDFLTTTKEH